jgi:pimeloyl-ACP methyl ester carboxylesterase
MDLQVGSARIRTGVGPLNVRQVGEGPIALLWHSLFIDSTSWQRVEAALADHRRLVLIDGPGHGLSGDPGHRYTMTDCATAALEVLEALAVTERVDWVGNAWGGHVGIVAATDHPGRLRTLIALGTPVRAYTTAERRQVQLLSLAYRLLGPARFLTDGVAEVQLSAATRAHDPAAVRHTTEFLRRADRRLLYNAIQSISLGREDLAARLPLIDIPTMFATGSHHAGFTPDEARAAIAQVQRGRLEIVSDAAYLIPLEQPAQATQMIIDFWRTAR